MMKWQQRVQHARQHKQQLQHPGTHLGVCALKLDEADALELARLTVHGQAHIDHGAGGLTKGVGQLLAHRVLACKGGDERGGGRER
jgi:hypothetical protein